MEQIFQQGLGRSTVTEEGRLFWANQLDSGASTRGKLILQVLLAGSSGTGRDSQVVANKLAAANSFTDYLVANPTAVSFYRGSIVAAGARAILSGVYETPTTGRRRLHLPHNDNYIYLFENSSIKV